MSETRSGRVLASPDESDETHIGLISELADDLETFASRLENGPSGWLVAPLMTEASRGMRCKSQEGGERTRGALLAIVYGLDVVATRRTVIEEVRRVAESMRAAVAAR